MQNDRSLVKTFRGGIDNQREVAGFGFCRDDFAYFPENIVAHAPLVFAESGSGLPVKRSDILFDLLDLDQRVLGSFLALFPLVDSDRLIVGALEFLFVALVKRLIIVQHSFARFLKISRALLQGRVRLLGFEVAIKDLLQIDSSDFGLSIHGGSGRGK